MLRRPSVVAVVALVILVSIAACAGTPSAGKPSAGTPVASEPTPTVAPATTPRAVSPTPGASIAGTATPDPGTGRPMSIDLRISSTNNSDGDYHASGPARLCGTLSIFAAEPGAFSFEFTGTAATEIEDVTFGAHDLLPGSSTALFSIGVNVKAKKGGQPPATVIHPDQPGSGDTGTATRTESGGTTTLVVDAVNDFGEVIHLEGTCGPRQ
jgi:hypothetical protein